MTDHINTNQSYLFHLILASLAEVLVSQRWSEIEIEMEEVLCFSEGGENVKCNFHQCRNGENHSLLIIRKRQKTKSTMTKNTKLFAIRSPSKEDMMHFEVRRFSLSQHAIHNSTNEHVPAL